MPECTSDNMRHSEDLALHRCAILGASSNHPGYSTAFEYLKDCITQTVAEGYRTFLTTANDGFELDAARFILTLKKDDN